MVFPLINILIRTSNRPQLFARCLESVKKQTYDKIRIIVGYDNARAKDYIPKDIEVVPVFYPPETEYFYDLYCNDLKARVTDGWFMFLDDDDYLNADTVIEQLVFQLRDNYYCMIFPMLRNGIAKPRKSYIKREIIQEGKIGLPCILIDSRFKHLADLDGHKAGDYRYIKAMVNQVSTRFIDLVVVAIDRRSRGAME